MSAVFLSACSSPSGPKGGEEEDNASLSGTVRAAGSAELLQGATVTAGAKQATTNASGHFNLTGLAPGSVTVRVERNGFQASEATVTLSAGSNVRDFTLSAAAAAVSLVGTVRNSITQVGMAGVTITVGAKQATTDASGHFELTGLTIGSATVSAALDGFAQAEVVVTLIAGPNTKDLTLTPLVQEVFITGGDAVYVPAGVGPMRGVIMVLGGPATKGFVTGQPIVPDGEEALENSLQALATSLRALAKTSRVALIGRTEVGLFDNEVSDAVLLNVLVQAAGASSHPEIADLPLMFYTLSGGARAASGFMSRHPERTIGLHLRVPPVAPNLSTPAAIAVPTFVLQAGADVVVNNEEVRQAFVASRAQHGLWSLVVEPSVPHDLPTPRGNSASIAWISEILALRLPATPGNPLVTLLESSGWLGNQVTLDFATWAAYSGDRATASWLQSAAFAAVWKGVGTSQ